MSNHAKMSLPIVAVSCFVATAAWAHALLLNASPPVGGAVDGSPAQVKLTYSEAVEPRFSSVEITTEDGRKIAVGALRAEGATLTAPLAQRLAPGRYKVTWRATSVDTHQTQGGFTFDVRP